MAARPRRVYGTGRKWQASDAVAGRRINVGGRPRALTSPDDVDLVAVDRACDGDLYVSGRLLPLERDIAIMRLVSSGVSGLETARRLGVSSRHVYRVVVAHRRATPQ